MIGSVIGAASGLSFGLFQSVNVRSARGVDPYVSTFLQIFVAGALLLLISVITDDIMLLATTSWWGIIDFAAAGLLHFAGGWTLLNLSQKRIGAARTSPLLTTVPVFGVALAAVTLGQVPARLAFVAIALIVGGAWAVVAHDEESAPWRWNEVLPGLGCSLAWALSPIPAVRGFQHLPSPLLGVTIGLVASTLVYGLALFARGSNVRALGADTLRIKLLAGVLVGVATWLRWWAIQVEEVGVVLALGLLSVPVVLLLAPVFAGRHLERVTRRTWCGSAFVIAGSLILIATQ